MAYQKEGPSVVAAARSSSGLPEHVSMNLSTCESIELLGWPKQNQSIIQLTMSEVSPPRPPGALLPWSSAGAMIGKVASMYQHHSQSGDVQVGRAITYFRPVMGS